MPGNGRPGEGRAWRRREASAQVRKSADCRERGGAASGSQPAGQVGCPGLTLGDSAGAACRGVSCRPSADFPKAADCGPFDGGFTDRHQPSEHTEAALHETTE
ncbi:uncharacterized protein LOC118148433 isoform X2 [Callithrix jacchus]